MLGHIMFLDGLFEAACNVLDNKILVAKEFEYWIRGTWQQVAAGVARSVRELLITPLIGAGERCIGDIGGTT